MNQKTHSKAITILWLAIPLLILTTNMFSQEQARRQQRGRASIVAPNVQPTSTYERPLTRAEISDQLAVHFTRDVNLDDMVIVPSGTFIFGPTDKTKAHEVYIDEFYIDQFEVTVADYATFLNELKALDWACQGMYCPQTHHTLQKAMGGMALVDDQFQPKAGYDRRPITAIDWEWANLYCRWAGKRLPTSAEWEKAARGEQGWYYPWGNDWRPDWADKINTIEATIFPLPVGSRPDDISVYGVYDMMGNATEWVADSSEDARDESQQPPIHTRRGVTAIDQSQGLLAQQQTWSVTVGVRCAYAAPPT